MNKIDELYKMAGVEKIELSYPDNIDPFYPEFTEEKQLKLIKFLACRGFGLEICTFHEWGKKRFAFIQRMECSDNTSFAEGLAGLIVKIWKELKEEEKREIKQILK